MIKRLLGLITLLAVLVLVAACGGAATPPAEQAAISTPAATEAAVPTATETAAPATVAATATEAAAATEEAVAEATEEATTEASDEATSEAITVVQNFWEAINQKNVDQAMTYIADDAILMGGQHTGKEEIRKAVEDMVRDGVTFELSEFKDEDGQVTYAGKVFQNGNEVYSGTGVNVVENGKIVFDGGPADVAGWLEQRSAPAEATEEATSEAITVVQNFWEAINQKNVDEAMTYIADDAILMGGQHTGKEQIRKALEDIVQRGDTFELSDLKDENGHVTGFIKVFNNGRVVYAGADGVDIVENGKIVFDGSTADAARWLEQRSASAEATGEATSEAITIVQNFYEAINQKNIDEAMTYVADDMIMMGGQYKGKEQIRKWVEDTVQKGDTFDLSDLKDEGGRVTYTVKVFNNGKVVYSGTGVDIVENGKIVVDE